MSDILKLFEGLDEKQVRQFRRAIVPALLDLRQRIIIEHEQAENKQRLQNGNLQSENQRGATVQNASVETK
jgi:hypothetical protein